MTEILLVVSIEQFTLVVWVGEISLVMLVEYFQLVESHIPMVVWVENFQLVESQKYFHAKKLW